MRRFTPRPGAGFLTTMLVAAALVFASSATAARPKVDPSLAAAADSVPPGTQLPVIVYGDAPGLARAAAHGKLKIRHRLGLIGADSATLPAAALTALSKDDRVDY